LDGAARVAPPGRELIRTSTYDVEAMASAAEAATSFRATTT
jgi:hypothetical protein